MSRQTNRTRLERELEEALGRADAAERRVARLERMLAQAQATASASAIPPFELFHDRAVPVVDEPVAVLTGAGGTELSDRDPQLARVVLDALPGVVYVVDTSGVIKLAGGRGLDILAPAGNSLVDRSIFDVRRDSPETATNIRAVVRGAARAWVDRLAGRSFAHQAIPLHNDSGQQVGVVGVMQDISERVRLMAELRVERGVLAQRVEERTRELQQANSDLEGALKAKDDFLAGMSHELRTPLTAILGLSEGLLEEVHGPLNPGQTQYIEGVIESGQHLLALINDILDIAKFRSGELELDSAPVDLRGVCETAIRMVQPVIERKRLKFRFGDDPRVSTIIADERRLKQMIVNLLANAVKFTQAGGELGLTIEASVEKRQVRITVWDRGIGIEPEKLGRLFRPFVQLNPRKDQKRGGTGLGLALVLSMAELHGGGVSVQSEPGRGSRFTITLPWSGDLVIDPQPTPADSGPRWDLTSFTGQTLTDERSLANAADIIALARKAARGAEAKQEKPLVLVVDDNQANLRTLSDYLRLHGFRVSTAMTGLEGVQKASLRKPALIIMDIQLPEMNGLEAIAHLRRQPQTRTVPIVALTALALPSDRRRCIAAGATSYFSKPVRLSKLLEVVRSHVSPRVP